MPVRAWQRLACAGLLGRGRPARAAVLTPSGRRRQRQPQLARRSAPVQSSPPSSPSSRWSCGRATSTPTSERRLGQLHARCSCRCRARSAAWSSGSSLVGHDLGTALVLLVDPARRCSGWSGAPPASSRRRRLVVAVVAARLVAHQRRTGIGRITDFARPAAPTTDGAGWQPVHGLYALADGGWFGVGLGASQREVGRPARGAHRLHLRRSSARSSAWSARCWCSACSPPSRYAAIRLVAPHRGPVRPLRDRRRHGLAARPDDDQHRHGARRCCRSSASRCRWSPTADRRWCRPWSRSACCCRFARHEPGLPEALAARAERRPPVAGGRCRPRRRGASPRPASGPSCASSSPAAAPPATSRRCSPLADALRRRDPDVRITALGTARGLEAAARARRAATRCELIPPVPLPAPPDADLLRLPGPAARRRRRGRARSLDRVPAPTSSSASAATSRCRPTSPPAGAACRSSSTSRTPCPASPTGSAPGSPPHVATTLPGHRRCRTPTYVGHAAAPDDRARSTGPRRGPRRCAHFGLDPDRPDAAGHRRLAGRRSGSTQAVAGARPRALARRRASRCCTSTGPGKEVEPEPPTRRPAVRRRCRTSTGWTSPTPPPTSCVCRAGANTVSRAAAVGLPAVFVPLPDRQRRAAAQRRRRRRRPAAACWSTTPT